MTTRRAVLSALLVSLGPVLLLGAAGCGGSSGGRDGVRVGVLHAVPDAEFAEDVVSKLEATGLFASVAAVDVGAGPVSAFSLALAFDAVLVIKDSGFWDPFQFGNVLADAVDDGVGVVLTVFCYEASVITGRFESDDYFTMTSGTASGGGPLGFGVDAPGHPLLTGVSVFGGGTQSFRTSGTAYLGATQVAHWLTPGSPPLIVERTLGNGRRRVDLGFFPVTSDISPSFVDPTDSVRMTANALLRVAGAL